LFLIF